MIWATADFVVWHLCGKDFESDVAEYDGICSKQQFVGAVLSVKIASIAVPRKLTVIIQIIQSR